MIFRRHKNILVERFDDRILLFNMDNNLPYVLNGVAAYIMECTDGVRNQKEIAQDVCQEFNVGFQKALCDIDKLYEDLITKRIVEQVG